MYQEEDNQNLRMVTTAYGSWAESNILESKEDSGSNGTITTTTPRISSSTTQDLSLSTTELSVDEVKKELKGAWKHLR